MANIGIEPINDLLDEYYFLVFLSETWRPHKESNPDFPTDNRV